MCSLRLSAVFVSLTCCGKYKKRKSNSIPGHCSIMPPETIISFVSSTTHSPKYKSRPRCPIPLPFTSFAICRPIDETNVRLKGKILPCDYIRTFVSSCIIKEFCFFEVELYRHSYRVINDVAGVTAASPVRRGRCGDDARQWRQPHKGGDVCIVATGLRSRGGNRP